MYLSKPGHISVCGFLVKYYVSIKCMFSVSQRQVGARWQSDTVRGTAYGYVCIFCFHIPVDMLILTVMDKIKTDPV
jgi:hypothetical protein